MERGWETLKIPAYPAKIRASKKWTMCLCISSSFKFADWQTLKRISCTILLHKLESFRFWHPVIFSSLRYKIIQHHFGKIWPPFYNLAVMGVTVLLNSIAPFLEMLFNSLSLWQGKFLSCSIWTNAWAQPKIKFLIPKAQN